MAHDGTYIPTIFSVSPLFDRNGNVIALLPEGKDITDLKRLQGKLERERLKTRQWLDSMNTYVALCDLEGRILVCNRPLEEAVGEAVGIKIYDFVLLASSEETRERIKKAIDKAANGQKENLEVRTLQDDIGQRAFIVSASPIYDVEGGISYLAVEAKDISEQVRLRELILRNEKEYSSILRKEVDDATRALKETELLNKNLVDSAPMGIIHLDEQGQLVFANPAIKEKLTSAGVDLNRIEGETVKRTQYLSSRRILGATKGAPPAGSRIPAREDDPLERWKGSLFVPLRHRAA